LLQRSPELLGGIDAVLSLRSPIEIGDPLLDIERNDCVVYLTKHERLKA